MFALKSFGQKDSIYAEFHIKSVTNKGKTIKLDSTKIVTLINLGTTEITSVGIINGDEIGLKFEILKSNLADEVTLVTGLGFFIKHDADWKIKGKIYTTHELKVISDKSIFNDKDFSRSSTSVGSYEEGIGIYFLARVYVLR